MAERTLRGARLGGQSFEDERGIEFAARQQVGYRCPQGHEFEITMSVEADVPAVWECPRCGAEALSTARHPARGEGREAGPHALGHAARAALREGARGHPQGAARAAPRRRDRPGAPAPRQRRRSGKRLRLTTLSRRRPPRPGRPGPRARVRGVVRRCDTPAIEQPPASPRPGRAAGGRPGGSTAGSAGCRAMSVTNPGVSIRVPPIRISAPSASSRAGIRPVSQRLAAAPARRGRPRCLISQAPRMRRRSSSSDRPPRRR